MKHIRLILIFALLCALLLTSGCGLFSSEYYVTEPFEVESGVVYGGEREVKNATALKSALLELVQAGESRGSFRFSNYSGSIVDDLSDISLEIRTENPLGAYAVESISYDTNRILSYYVAEIDISYKVSKEDILSIVNISDTDELKGYIYDALDNYYGELVFRVYSPEIDGAYISSYIEQCYYSDPLFMVEAPEIAVRTYPQSGNERIFVLELNYPEDIQHMKEMEYTLRARATEMAMSLGQDTPFGYVVRCATSLAKMCHNSTQLSDHPETAYGCLVDGSEEPLAMALGYKALCDSLGISCYVVKGEEKFTNTDHYWNIIGIYGEYYHMDVSRYYQDSSYAIMLSDKDLSYRYDWDESAYPQCDGPLGPEAVYYGTVPVETPALPSPSPTITPTPTPTPSQSPTPSLSPSPSPSQSLSPEISPEVSPELSPEVSPGMKPEQSPEIEPDVSASPQLSPSASPDVDDEDEHDGEHSPAVSWSPAPSFSPAPSESPAASWSPEPSLSPDAGESPSGGEEEDEGEENETPTPTKPVG